MMGMDQPKGLPALTGRARRESDRALRYWEGKLAQLGVGPTINALDLAAIHSTEWTNRFLIAIDQTVEASSLLLYGRKFAHLLGLPEKARLDLPLEHQLPERFTDLFFGGCAEITRQKSPVSFEREVARGDNHIEQYRAVFIPVGVRPNSLTYCAFGAFNSRVLASVASA